jgi:hypothetical protein
MAVKYVPQLRGIETANPGRQGVGQGKAACDDWPEVVRASLNARSIVDF